MKRILSLSLLFSFLAIVPLGVQSVCQAQIHPWPWASTKPFPWNNIQGTWTEKSTEYTLSFQVIKNSSGDKLIRINQIDSETGAIIARGLGSENSSHVVVAAMTGGPLRHFTLTIRSLQNVYCWNEQDFIGVTIESFDNELLNYFEIYKINELPLTPTKSKIYKEPHCGDVM